MGGGRGVGASDGGDDIEMAAASWALTADFVVRADVFVRGDVCCEGGYGL